MESFSIIDCYIDEPSCLGVPPFISPYPRYITGAILDVIPQAFITYYTIDQLRLHKELLNNINTKDMVIFIAGSAVPGRYLTGYPASPKELTTIASQLHKPLKMLCGPAARFGCATFGGKKTTPIPLDNSLFHLHIQGDPEIVIHKFLTTQKEYTSIDIKQRRKDASSIAPFAIKGARIVTQHPFFPHRLLAEIETYRGCSRAITGGCSFCSEPLNGKPDFRLPEEIIAEVESLYSFGVRHIRLGNQPCLFSYLSKQATNHEYPKPNPEALETLFSGIRNHAPDLQTLHIDNVNPGIVASYPDESIEIIKTILHYHTPGDVAAFGVESVDPHVIEENNLKADEEEVFQAITLFNQFGRKRGNNGMSELLPGLNFVFGLKGETKQTYKLNYAFLQKILKHDLLIRRINLRQVIPLPHTGMENIGTKILQKNKKLFYSFKRSLKETIEQPLLRKLVPILTTLTDVILEVHKGKHSFGRQMGSYPLLVGVHGVFPLEKSYAIVITDHGYRSVTGFPFPFYINVYPREAIEGLPGIGKKRAIRILRNRPFQSTQEFSAIFNDPSIPSPLLPYLSFKSNENIDE